MQTYTVYKFDSNAVVLKDSQAYRVVPNGSDKSIFWDNRQKKWCESLFTAKQLESLATLVGKMKMQLK